MLQVRADYRFIDTHIYALPFSLRFPRIKRVRYDKSFSECMSDREARDMLESSKNDPLVNLDFTTANMLRCNEKSAGKKRSGSVHQASHRFLFKTRCIIARSHDARSLAHFGAWRSISAALKGRFPPASLTELKRASWAMTKTGLN
jgi:hypothetical protein